MLLVIVSRSVRISSHDSIFETYGWMMMFLRRKPPVYDLVAGRKQTVTNRTAVASFI